MAGREGRQGGGLMAGREGVLWPAGRVMLSLYLRPISTRFPVKKDTNHPESNREERIPAVHFVMSVTNSTAESITTHSFLSPLHGGHIAMDQLMSLVELVVLAVGPVTVGQLD